jgi:hypothetical protein
MGVGKVPELTIIDPDAVDSADPKAGDGIELDKQGHVVNYRIQSDQAGSTKDIIIPASDIVHIKLNVDANVKRGRTTLEPVLRYLKMYDEWVKDRMVLNKVRSSIALVRQVEGTAAQIEQIRNRGKATSNQFAGANKQRMLQPGSILTPGPGVKYEMLSPNINAADAKDDGKNILLAVAAGIGFPEMFLTADYSNANYSSTLIAQNPLVREFEDWQDFFDIFFQDLIQDILAIGKNHGDLSPDETLLELVWPPLIHRDLKELAEVLLGLFNVRAISRETMDAELGYTYKEEIEKIEKEEEEHPPELLVPTAAGGARPPPTPPTAEGGGRKRVQLNGSVAA